MLSSHLSWINTCAACQWTSTSREWHEEIHEDIIKHLNQSGERWRERGLNYPLSCCRRHCILFSTNSFLNFPSLSPVQGWHIEWVPTMVLYQMGTWQVGPMWWNSSRIKFWISQSWHNWAVVVDRLVEWSLPTPEIRRWSPVIRKF